MARFSSVSMLIWAVIIYIASLNENLASFEWTATADEILEKIALVDRHSRKLLARNLQ